MTPHTILSKRNEAFAARFNKADLPVLPALRTVILACVDARVDPAEVLDLDLGEAVVMRNNGARVTQAVLDDIATLAFMAAKMDGDAPGPFRVILVQHTHCGAERFADPGFQAAVKGAIGIDVSGQAITNQSSDLMKDIETLRASAILPDYVEVSAMLYDVKTGAVNTILEPVRLRP